MKSKLLFLGALAVLFSTLASAEPQSWTILFSGSKVGQGTWEDFSDGRFAGTTQLKLGPLDYDGKVSGALVAGKLDTFTMDVLNAGKKSSVQWTKGKLSAKAEGRPDVKDVPLPIDSPALFLNFMPGILRTVFAEHKTNPAKNEITIFMLDSFNPIKVGIRSSKQTSIIKSEAIDFDVMVLNIGGLEATYVVHPDGSIVGMNVPVQQIQFVRDGFEAVFVDPLGKYKELSQPTLKSTTDRSVKMKTRDGAELVADVVRPETPGQYPTVLIRTPYGREASALTGDFWAKRGYVVVAQDVRGRGASTGVWDPFNREVLDGFDTLDWIVKQPWSNGKVGMIGGSYLGLVQWAAVASKHPALKAIIPQVSPPPPVHNIPWDNGAFMLMPNVWWSRIVMNKDADMTQMAVKFDRFDLFNTLPLTKVDDKVLGRDVPFYNSWLTRNTSDKWLGAFTMADVANCQIPVLHVSGVWDGDAVGTKMHWEALRRAGKTDQWLIYGPWDHAFNTKRKLGDTDYGPSAILELDSTYLRFFDTHLKGMSVSMDRVPKAKVFVTGANQWYTGSDFPFPYSKPAKFFLSGSKANGMSSKARLSPRLGPSERNRYVYDPNSIKIDTKAFEAQAATASFKLTESSITKNTLVFATSPFASSTVITGPLKAEIFISTTAKDATFHMMPFEERPSGERRVVGQSGQKRVWFELGKPQPIVPGKVYKINIEPWLFAHRFEAGSKFGVLLTSDYFPVFARNPGTGEPDAKAKKLVRATHTVLQGKSHPSSITVYTFQP